MSNVFNQSYEELYHYGRKGMEWGKHKYETLYDYKKNGNYYKYIEGGGGAYKVSSPERQMAARSANAASRQRFQSSRDQYYNKNSGRPSLETAARYADKYSGKKRPYAKTTTTLTNGNGEVVGRKISVNNASGYNSGASNIKTGSSINNIQAQFQRNKDNAKRMSNQYSRQNAYEPSGSFDANKRNAERADKAREKKVGDFLVNTTGTLAKGLNAVGVKTNDPKVAEGRIRDTVSNVHNGMHEWGDAIKDTGSKLGEEFNREVKAIGDGLNKFNSELETSVKDLGSQLGNTFNRNVNAIGEGMKEFGASMSWLASYLGEEMSYSLKSFKRDLKHKYDDAKRYAERTVDDMTYPFRYWKNRIGSWFDGACRMMDDAFGYYESKRRW